MMFTDDILMFLRADTTSIQLLLHAFNSFSQASGLEANIHKSNISIGGISDNLAAEIHELTLIPLGFFPLVFHYQPRSSHMPLASLWWRNSFLEPKPGLQKCSHTQVGFS